MMINTIDQKVMQVVTIEVIHAMIDFQKLIREIWEGKS